jgi:hypothetical protein
MKILLTGCTAQQTSRVISEKLPTFSSALQDMLMSDHEVDLLPPTQDLVESVEEYDAVVVGLAPLTSVTANKIYPAFVLANRAKEVGNLILSVDAPEPHKIQASINSYKSGKADLLKKFYSRRKNYYHLVNDKNFRKNFFQFVDFLSDEEWPSLIYPTLSWQGSSVVADAFPNVDRSNLYGIQIDAHLLSSSSSLGPLTDPAQAPYWVCDAPETKWSKVTQRTLSYSTLPIKTRSDSPESIEERLSSAVAALVAVYRSQEPWWSPLLSRALNASIPVVTEWRYSSTLGECWSLLGSDIEILSAGERLMLADEQRKTYINSINSAETVCHQVQTIIKETAA